jgi:transcription elongation factor Elf1
MQSKNFLPFHLSARLPCGPSCNHSGPPRAIHIEGAVISQSDDAVQKTEMFIIYTCPACSTKYNVGISNTNRDVDIAHTLVDVPDNRQRCTGYRFESFGCGTFQKFIIHNAETWNESQTNDIFRTFTIMRVTNGTHTNNCRIPGNPQWRPCGCGCDDDHDGC